MPLTQLTDWGELQPRNGERNVEWERRSDRAGDFPSLHGGRDAQDGASIPSLRSRRGVRQRKCGGRFEAKGRGSVGLGRAREAIKV